jgi:hypothetical protein
VNVRRFRLTLECSFKHLLRRNVLAAIELDDATIVKRVSIAWENAFGPQARLRNREIRSRASCDFRYLRILVYQNSKLIPRFRKTASCKLAMRTLEGDESCRLILRGWSWRWWRSRCGSNSSNRSLLLRRFDP